VHHVLLQLFESCRLLPAYLQDGQDAVSYVDCDGVYLVGRPSICAILCYDGACRAICRSVSQRTIFAVVCNREENDRTEGAILQLLQLSDLKTPHQETTFRPNSAAYRTRVCVRIGLRWLPSSSCHCRP
jgi:hypothetical protein